MLSLRCLQFGASQTFAYEAFDGNFQLLRTNVLGLPIQLYLAAVTHEAHPGGICLQVATTAHNTTRHCVSEVRGRVHVFCRNAPGIASILAKHPSSYLQAN